MTNLYGNIAVFSPDDILMFYTSEKKLSFYVKKDLVERIDDKTYKLTFAPKGLGLAEMKSRGNLLIPRENRCVITGIDNPDVLTRHHIVPTCYRKHFPLKHKWNFQFVVFVEINKHFDYTTIEHKFYDEIAKMYDTPTMKECGLKYDSEMRIYKIARCLKAYAEKLPVHKRKEMELSFLQTTGEEPTSDNLDKYNVPSLKQRHNKQIQNVDFGKAVADKITDYEAFNMMWLNHFVDTMKPKFLPEDLKEILKR